MPIKGMIVNLYKVNSRILPVYFPGIWAFIIKKGPFFFFTNTNKQKNCPFNAR